MFTKILIANRGEIACRVARTARRMGIRTVAVYSDADADALHVESCDEAYRLGPAAPRESYLNADAILAIAAKSGAQAIHPGYGFLSENEAFAEACAKAGVAFIGPPPRAIAAMGSKSAAKTIMADARVPLVPGYHGDDQEPALLAREAAKIGFPVLIKATAGGGGKGMKIVTARRRVCGGAGVGATRGEGVVRRRSRAARALPQLAAPHRDPGVRRHARRGGLPVRAGLLGAAAAPEGARGSAGAGDGADAAARDGRGGGRRGQGDRLRRRGHRRIHRRAGRHVLFHGDEHAAAGRAPRHRNDYRPRPGRMAVARRLRRAAAEARRTSLRSSGHAIEARLYAEDPERGFLPSIGRISHWRMPPRVRSRVRVDTGVREGDEISPFYDPMLAKLIVWGEDRETALRGNGRGAAPMRGRRCRDQHRVPASGSSPMTRLPTRASTPDSSKRIATRLFPPPGATPEAALIAAAHRRIRRRSPGRCGCGQRLRRPVLALARARCVVAQCGAEGVALHIRRRRRTSSFACNHAAIRVRVELPMRAAGPSKSAGLQAAVGGSERVSVSDSRHRSPLDRAR